MEDLLEGEERRSRGVHFSSGAAPEKIKGASGF